MNEQSSFMRFLADQFATTERERPPSHASNDILIAARRMRPLPRWLALLKEPPMRISSRVAVGSPTARVTTLVILLMALSVLTAGGIAVGATLLASPAPAGACPPGGGAFVPAPAMTQPRIGAVAATLSGGRVLVAGGEDLPDRVVPTAELWDPGTGAFHAAGTVAAFPLRAVALGGGRVLVVPNRDGRAQLWDPATEAFSMTGPLDPPRGDNTATRLSYDRVLVIGGDLHGGPSEVPLALAKAWAPHTGEWQDAGEMGHPRKDHTATLLADGRVLVVGGNGAPETPIGAAELWNPKTGTFIPGSTMAAARAGHQAVLLPGGRVLIVGGIDATGPVAGAELWDPATGAFTPAGALITPRANAHTLTLLEDGRVLVVGGYRVDFRRGEPVGAAEAWDPATLTCSPAGTLLVPRAQHVAAAQPDCSVLIIGGQALDLDSNVERWVPGA